MTNLIEEFDRFQRSRYSPNPDGESPTTAFIRHLAEEKMLLEYGEVDWLKLAEKLDLSDDQYGQLMEGVASWIPQEPVPPSEQEPADWPDEVPRGALTSPPSKNPAVRYSKGSAIEDCACEESCNCGDDCPCDECKECKFCLCCCVCEESEDGGDSDEGEDNEDGEGYDEEE